MDITAVAYFKGGVGKSTVAAHLATYYAKQGSCLFIDGDPQESGATWAAWRREYPDLPTPTTICLRGKAIYDEGREMAKNFDHTVVDVGGRDGSGVRNALLLANKLIIPMKKSGFDASVIDEFLTVLSEASDFNRNIKAKVLLNIIDARTKTTDVEEFIRSRDLEIFNTVIKERRAYVDAIDSGRTVFDYRPRNGAALFELKKFIEEVENWT